MDEIDREILQALEQDARLPLQKIANKLDLKISTIYNRLLKLQNARVLESSTCVVNPAGVGLHHHFMFYVDLDATFTKPSRDVFLEGLSRYLVENFVEIDFLSLIEHEDAHRIFFIASFHSIPHLKVFFKKVRKLPYVHALSFLKMKKVLKGKRVFTFSAARSPLNPERSHLET